MTSKRYRLVIPYTEEHPDHPGKVFEASVEVSAATVAEARKFGLTEFQELAKLSGSRWVRHVIEDRIRVQELAERAGTARFTLERSSPAPGVVAVTLGGVLDAQSMEQFKAVVEEAIEQNSTALIVDMTKVAYMNSSCIGLLIGHLDDIRILLVGIPQKILRVFKMLGIDMLFGTFRSIGDAVKSIG